MRFISYILLFLNITSILSVVSSSDLPETLPEPHDSNPKIHTESNQTLIVVNNPIATNKTKTANKNPQDAPSESKDEAKDTQIKNARTGSVSSHTNLPHVASGNEFEMQSGALLRGFYVVLGITMILIMYLGIKTFRLRNGSKPPAMVRKYGILASRGDVEMLPLPLSEDEDDDTVFELSHVNK